MEDMTGDRDYDWVDDDSLDLDETMQKFEQLEPAQVSVNPLELHFVEVPATRAGKAAEIIKSFYGPRRLASTIT